ncbi:MAG: HDOD domain-containing protein [Desulfovibrionaceae bacterium]
MIVYIAQLKEGMTLASKATAPNGRLLLPAGTVLTEQHLRVFNIWGVSEADIVDPEGAPDTQPSLEADAASAQAQDHAAALFAAADTATPPMAALKAVCIQEYTGQLVQSGTLPAPPQRPMRPQPPSEPAPPRALADFIAADTGLTSLPDIYDKITRALDDPLCSANRLADVISKDPGISARLLRLVNSPLYGAAQRIESLDRAVCLVGAQELSQLALGVTVMATFQGVGSAAFPMAAFWRHSLACAVFSRILAAQVAGASRDRCFVAGMLHDLGRLVMFKIAPEAMGRAIQLAQANGVPMHRAEREVFGFSHCQVATALMETWNLPPALTGVVAGHHGPADGEHRVEAAICAMGDVLAIALQHGSNGSGLVHAPFDGAWEALGLPESALATTVLKAHRQIDDILAIFLR